MIYLNFNILDEPLPLEDMTVLSIEDTRLFTTLVENFYTYDENSDIKLFNDRQDALPKNQVIPITDLLTYDLNPNTLLKRILNDITQQLNEKLESKSKLESLLFEIEDLLKEELVDHELNLQMDDCTTDKLLKLLKIKVDDREPSLFKRMETILNIQTYLGKKKLPVFINTLSYFTKSEREGIAEYIYLNDLHALFLEPRKVQNCEQFYIDRDFFLSRI